MVISDIKVVGGTAAQFGLAHSGGVLSRVILARRDHGVIAAGGGEALSLRQMRWRRRGQADPRRSAEGHRRFRCCLLVVNIS